MSECVDVKSEFAEIRLSVNKSGARARDALSLLPLLFSLVEMKVVVESVVVVVVVVAAANSNAEKAK